MRIDPEGWQIGDLARCVADDWAVHFPANPRQGDTLRVVEVTEGMGIATGDLHITLGFEGKPSNMYWACTCFRKLRHVHCAADDWFVAQMRVKEKSE